MNREGGTKENRGVRREAAPEGVAEEVRSR